MHIILWTAQVLTAEETQIYISHPQNQHVNRMAMEKCLICILFYVYFK